jgi:Restriction endonuclease NaeI
MFSERCFAFNLSMSAWDAILQGMTILFPLRLAESHCDYQLLKRLEDAIYECAGGQQKFEADIPALLRQAIDEVIDPSRSKRFTLEEIEKTEKTYLGTKIEILLRNALGLERGPDLDLLIDGIQVDVKNTVGSAWTIPNEALGHPCILISTNEAKATCSFGLIVIRAEVLNAGRNRDQKTTIKKSELVNVYWLLKDAPYPPNFWLSLTPEDRRAIVTPRGGSDRVAMLFRLHQKRPISRKLIVALAQQEDPMRRVRKNGGARDSLALEGIEILSGMTKRKRIAELGLPFCRTDEFISISR